MAAAEEPLVESALKDTDCTNFLQWALPQLGLYWPGFRRVRRQVCKRLRRRVAAMGLADLSDYRAILQAEPHEWAVLDGLCRISISRFYRNRGIWISLEEKLLPRLAARALRRGEGRLRIWSAGCASGEEPYTVAIMFQLGTLPCAVNAEIVATDADEHMLDRARRGCYRQSSLRELPVVWRTAFQQSGDDLCLRAAYRVAVRFLQQDIRTEQPHGSFDLILCRNLAFTYYAVPVQATIARRLSEALVPGGFLVLGSHESLPQPSAGLVQERPWLYREDTEAPTV